MARPRLKGSTDQSVTLYIVDDTDGTPEQGVVYNTASIALWYRREGAAKVALSLVTLASASASHTDSGLIHVEDGVYRLDLPDAAFASGAGEVVVGGSVPDMVVLPVTIPLVDYDSQDAAKLGLSNITDILADTNELQSDDVPTLIAALPTAAENRTEIDSNSTQLAAIVADTSELQTDWANGGRLDLILDSAGTGGGLDAAGVRAAVGLASANLDTQLSTIDTVVDANGAILTKVNSGLEEDGTGIYRWTTNAMELAPGGATNGSNVGSVLGTALTETTSGILAGNFSAYIGAGGAAAAENINNKFFTTAEKNQIRYMIGIDGTTAAPASNTPSLATAANQTTILNRLGAWTGTGVNTILGGFKALLSKTATAPSDIGGTFAPADDSVEAIRDRGDAEWTSGGGGSTTDWTSDEREEIRYRLGLDGTATAPSTGTPTLPVNVTLIEGADPSDTLNAAFDTAIADASLATAAALTTSQGVITTAISGLNDISAADVNTQCDSAIVDAALATAASLTTVNSGLTTLINGLNDISATDVGTQVDAELAAHGAATSTNVTDAVTTLQTSITAGHTTYDAATAAELTATQTAITTAISALNDLSAAQVNTQVDLGIADASLATAAALTTSQGVITTAISALNDLSEAQVNTQVDLGITDAALATAASLTAARTSIEGLVNGLQDVSLTSIGTQVASELSTHGTATSTNVSDSQTAITTAIAALDDVSSSDVTTAVTSALTSYDAATGTDVSTSTSTIQTAISGLSSGAVTCTVTGVAQESGRVTLKRGNPSTLVFTVAAIAMDDVLLGIRDIAGNSMLKIAGTIDSATQCTFNISASAALNLIDGDDHNLDVFEVDGYTSSTGAYTDAKHLASSPVTVQPLYLRLETN